MKRLMALSLALVVASVSFAFRPLTDEPLFQVSPEPVIKVDPTFCDPQSCAFGVATTYNAENHACAGQKCWVTKYGAWWTKTAPRSKRWISASEQGCKKHPEWKCYYKHFSTWRKLVRPYSANLTVYAAAGPELRKLISKAYNGFPRLWHIEPHVLVRFWQVLKSGAVVSQEILIVDVCSCERLADFSPGAWKLFKKVNLSTGGWDHHLYAEVVKP